MRLAPAEIAARLLGDIHREKLCCVLRDQHDACLIVDEAHAIRSLRSRGGRSLCRSRRKTRRLGGCAGQSGGDPRRVRRWSAAASDVPLGTGARSFVFSTAPSPRLAELTRVHVQLTRTEAEPLRAMLASNAALLRSELRAAGLPLAANSFGPIVSVILAENERVLAAAQRLRDVGILAQAIPPAHGSDWRRAAAADRQGHLQPRGNRALWQARPRRCRS